jgi:hypothetical protein
MASSSRDARYALVIAVDSYQDPSLLPLEAPLDDARRIAGVLTAPEIGDFRHVDVLSNPDARTAQEKIELFFTERHPLDIVVLHFSGHAFRGERSGDLFLAMTDTSRRRPFATSVSGDFLRTMLERSPAGRKLVLLDCCHSGALTLTRGAEEFSDGVGRIVPSRADPRDSGTGTIIIGAARAAERSHDSGALTGAVVEGLRTGDADLHRTGKISTENLFEYVTLWFRRHRPDQHPVLQQRSRSGPFIVAENCRYQPDALPAELEERLGAADAASRGQAVAALRERTLLSDLDDAATARRRLQHVSCFDVDADVKAAAAEALRTTSLDVDPAGLHFGPVRGGDPPAHLIAHVVGPPLGQGWRVLDADHPAVSARRSGDRLDVFVRPDRPGPVDTVVHLTSDAGDAAVRVTATVRRPSVVALAAGRLRRALDRPPAAPDGRHRLLSLAVLLCLLVAATSFRPVSRTEVLGWCIPRSDLRIVTTEALRGAIEAAAASFPASAGGDDACPDVRVTVTAVSSDGPAERQMARQWPDDELRVAGPTPDVWVPESSARVGLARAAIRSDAPRRLDLPDGEAARALSVAASPLVLAVPAAADVPATLTWSDVLKRGWTIPRADPRNSTTGLLATYALYRAAEPQAAEKILERSPGGDDARFDLCRLRLSPVAPADDTAYLVTAKDVADYNAGEPLGDACRVTGEPAQNRRLRAVPLAGAPALDVPCVPIRGPAWGDDEQRRLAGAFCDHLRGDGRRALTGHGLTPPDPAAGPRAPDAAAAEEVIGTWGSAQRPVRMLLAMDVSGSMALPVPGTGTPRITATVTAARNAVTRSELGAGDEVGLWEFATRLSGARDHRELVPLGGATADRQNRMARALGALAATDQDTGLHDTIGAGIERLRRDQRPDADFPPVSLLVVLTDGENDDVGSISVTEIGRRLRDSGVQVSVIASVGANCRAFRPLVEQGLSCFDESLGGLAAAFDKALPARLSAGAGAGR